MVSLIPLSFCVSILYPPIFKNFYLEVTYTTVSKKLLPLLNTGLNKEINNLITILREDK